MMVFPSVAVPLRGIIRHALLVVAAGLLLGADPRPAVQAVDRVLADRLQQAGRPMPPPADDAVFLRRISLDVCGILPTPAEVRSFIADAAIDKRERCIDRLLERPEAADRWAQRWGDLLRIKAEFPSNLWPKAVAGYHRWVRDAWRTAMPYDRFARDLLTASGSAFTVPPANFWRTGADRTPRRCAAEVLRVFHAVRLDACGADLAGIDAFAACFAQARVKPTGEWKEEVVWRDRDAVPAVAPGPLHGAPFALDPTIDPRRPAAGWIIDHPRFARALANRTWHALVGAGPSPVDDLAGPEAVPGLLDLLGRELSASGHDVRHLYRIILRSAAYQAVAKDDGAGDPLACTAYRLRRLDAEVLLDAINQATGSGERYVSMIPEPFTYLPADQRATALADGSISLPFLELFGRPARASGTDDERSRAPSALQAQHLLNSNHIQAKVARLKALPAGQAGVDELWLRFLSRRPDAAESAAAAAHRAAHADEAIADLAWTLINTLEFQLAH
jgi:hypothetical protein